MMIRSIIFIRVLFADLLFRFRNRDFSDERRRLVRGGGAFSCGRHFMMRSVRTGDMWHQGAGGVTLSSEHRLVWPCRGRHSSQDPDVGSAGLRQQGGCRECGHSEGMAPVLFWAHTGWHLRHGQHRVCHIIQESVPWPASSDSGPAWLETPAWPGRTGASLVPASDPGTPTQTCEHSVTSQEQISSDVVNRRL